MCDANSETTGWWCFLMTLPIFQWFDNSIESIKPMCGSHPINEVFTFISCSERFCWSNIWQHVLWGFSYFGYSTLHMSMHKKHKSNNICTATNVMKLMEVTLHTVPANSYGYVSCMGKLCKRIRVVWTKGNASDPSTPGMEQVYSKEHTFSCWSDCLVVELGYSKILEVTFSNLRRKIMEDLSKSTTAN